MAAAEIAIPAAGAGEFRADGGRGGSGAGRGRRQPRRGQSAARRYRQYGLCRGGRSAGRPHRRHRPGRSDRQPAGHGRSCWSLRNGGAFGASSSTNSAAMQSSSMTAWRLHNAARACGRWAYCPSSPRRGACRRRTRNPLNGAAKHNGKAVIKIAVPQFARIANFDDLDPLMAEDDVEVDIVPPGQRSAGRCRSHHPARLEIDHRRPGAAARRGLGYRHCSPSAPRRISAGAMRGLSDAGPDPGGSRGN